MDNGRTRVLLIEDNPEDTRIVREALAGVEGWAFELECVDRLSAGLRRLTRGGLDVVLLDLLLPDSHGLDTVTRAYNQAPSVPILVLTGLDNDMMAGRLVEQGAQDYLVKSQIGSVSLVRAIRLAIGRKNAAGKEALARGQIAETIPQGVLLISASASGNPILYSNPAFERMTGYAPSELAGRECWFLWGPEKWPATAQELVRSMSHDYPSSVEVFILRKDQSRFWGVLSVSPLRDAVRGVTHFVWTLTDVSERKRLEEQLVHSQQLECLDRLTAGVVHDFNNVLTVINLHSDLLLHTLHQNDPEHELAAAIKRSGARAAELTAQLLDFSSKRSPPPPASLACRNEGALPVNFRD